MFEAYLAVLIGVTAGQISPGPNLAATASMALAHGRGRALMVVLGVASAIFFWCSATALGLASLVEIYPFSLTLMRFAGGAYLIYVAMRSLRAALRGGVGGNFQATPGKPGLVAAYRRGLFVNLTNPKSGMLWTGIATYLYGSGLSVWQVVGFAPIGALSACVIYGIYAVLFSTGLAQRGYQRFARAFEGVFAAAFGLMGAGLVWSGIREIRP